VRIWYVGGADIPETVDGINSTVWALAKAQARLGHQVCLVVSRVEEAALTAAKETGIELLVLPNNRWRYEQRSFDLALFASAPAVVHVFGMYQPHLATLAMHLRRRAIPYVVSPAGGVDPPVLRRHSLRKSVYIHLVEKSRFARASAITAVTPAEERNVRAFSPGYGGIVRCVPNPVDLPGPGADSTTLTHRGRRLVCLTRYDVYHKGIDILVEIARLSPALEFDLYGPEDPRTERWFRRVREHSPANVRFHGPVFGKEKLRVLQGADAYIQTSRYEAFGVSIAEAMQVGLPCALSRGCSLSEFFDQHGLGIVLPSGVNEAARVLQQRLSEPHLLRSYAQRARAFAEEHFAPLAVARKYLEVYEQAVERATRTGKG
jgi:glycosyltransferase involved in cell wall biosynthesis